MTGESIEDSGQRLVAAFSPADDPIDRYRRLVELGEGLARLPAEQRTEENLLPGCQYAVWLSMTYDRRADALRLGVDSDARIVRGLAALILQIVDGRSPAEVAAADFGFLTNSGVRAQLSVHRGNGLVALIEEIQRRARAYLEGAHEAT
jgi:cysteine desulfuration protein SufE